MPDCQPEKKMSKEWKDKLWMFVSGILIAIIPMLIITSMTMRYDERSSIKEKVQELNDKKADKTELMYYVDKQDQAVKDEFNSKLNIIIENQKSTNEMLREFIKDQRK